MRRKPGVLLPIELDILTASASRAGGDDEWMHGYALAKILSQASGSQRLTAHGTLYKALGRLADGGLLEHRWEDPDAALAEGRPRRRLYRITGIGQAAVANAREDQLAVAPQPRTRISPA